MSKHTELPWRDGGWVGTMGTHVIIDASGRIVASLGGPPDNQAIVEHAEFIARACNSHADLLEACKSAIKELNRMLVRSDLVVHQLREAIAKAEGGER